MDGTCIYATVYHGQLLVTTLNSLGAPQAKVAKEYIGDSWKDWDPGCTFGFELISDSDPKVQINREACGLYLTYGVTHSFVYYTLEELVSFTKAWRNDRIHPVPFHTISKQTFIKYLQNFDDVDLCEKVREGFVIGNIGNLHKVKTWSYQKLAAMRYPTKSWFAGVVKKSVSMPELHDEIERFAKDNSFLDAGVIACNMLVSALKQVAEMLDTTQTLSLQFETKKEIAMSNLSKPEKSMLHKNYDDNEWLYTEDAILYALKLILGSR